MNAPTFTKTGTKATAAVKLDTNVFAVMPENYELIKLVYDAYLANGRDNLAQTKTRGLISGGGKKPWKQKGTGRARFGSSRNPIWRGGGIVFGPTGEENYTKKVTTVTKRTALRQALSLAAKDGRIKVVESLDTKGKTVELVNLFKKIDAYNGSVLLVTDTKDELLVRAASNLSKTKLVQASYLTVYDILNSDHLVVTQKSLEIIKSWLAPGKEAK